MSCKWICLGACEAAFPALLSLRWRRQRGGMVLQAPERRRAGVAYQGCFVNIYNNKNDLLKVRIQLAGMGGMAGRETKTGR